MGLGRGPIGYPQACWSSAFNMSSVTGKGSVGPVEGVLRDVSKGTEFCLTVRTAKSFSKRSLLYSSGSVFEKVHGKVAWIGGSRLEGLVLESFPNQDCLLVSQVAILAIARLEASE